MLKFIATDGGRALAGYKGKTNDCAVRALSVLSRTGGQRYKEIYDSLATGMKALTGKKTVRDGVAPAVYEPIFRELGFIQLSDDCDELVMGDKLDALQLRRDHEYLIRLRKSSSKRKTKSHVVAVANLTIYDGSDPRNRDLDLATAIWKRPKTTGRLTVAPAKKTKSRKLNLEPAPRPIDLPSKKELLAAQKKSGKQWIEIDDGPEPQPDDKPKPKRKKATKKAPTKPKPKPKPKKVAKTDKPQNEPCDWPGCDRSPAPHGTEARYMHESRYHGKLAICDDCRAGHKKAAADRKARRLAKKAAA